MKIFYIMSCSECHHCIYSEYNRSRGLRGWCVETEKAISDVSIISDECELEDADKFIEWKKEHEKNNQANLE